MRMLFPATLVLPYPSSMKSIAILSLLLLAACGTHVFEHVVEISIDDPTHRLGEKVQVSVFDHSMGYSMEWALRDMRVVTPDRAFVGRWSTADAVAIGNSGPRPALDLAFAFPQLSRDGYFFIALEPVDGETKQGTAAFTSYGAYFPDQRGPSLPVRYLAREAKNGWHIQLTAQVPPQ